MLQCFHWKCQEQLATRMLSTEALVDSNKLRNCRLSSDDWVRLASSANVLCGLPLYIDDIAITVQIKAKLRRMKNIGLVVIDYLQLMTCLKLIIELLFPKSQDN